MSNIERYLKTKCKQTAVYWPAPEPDEYGKNVYGTPYEIPCLWSGSKTLIKNDNGQEVVSKAKVHVINDLDDQGMIWKGKLDDLTEDEKANPILVKDAFEIKEFIKIPSFRGGYNRMALI